MNIYAFTSSEAVEYLNSKLQQKFDYKLVHSEEKDVNLCTELFLDISEKILIIQPRIINWSLPTEVLAKIKNLRGICTSSAWARYIDFEYCKANNISVAKTNNANSQSVAEYGIWMMYSLARMLPIQLQNKKDDQYQTELFGKTLGIIGLGNIGSRIAQLGSGIGMKIQYWNRTKKENSYEAVTLENLLRTSDVVVNSVEICDDTQGMLNKTILSNMMPSAFFISVLGGMGWGVQDDQCLIDMVQSGNLAGFAVENENKGSWQESYSGNIFIPSARAHHTKEAEDRVKDQWIEGIISVLNNTPSPFKIL